MRIAFVTIVLTSLLLIGCADDLDQQKADAPAPEEITREDIGYYCNMIVADHLGPKGQVHIDGRDDPVWFSSVRDAIVFTLLPEEPKNIAAIYVNDMGRQIGLLVLVIEERTGAAVAPGAVDMPFDDVLDAYVEAGLTKFVIRPVGSAPLDGFIDRFVAELVGRQN